MAETATKLPIKTDQKATSAAASAPWAPLESLHREIDRLFDMVGGGAWRFPFARAPFELGFAWPRQAALDVMPAVDIAEREKEYEIAAELPGLTEKDIEVKLANGALTIRGEKKEEKEEHDKNYHLSERRYGSFVRSFPVPDDVEADKIEAAFAGGVLTIKLPKTAAAQKSAKTTEVKAA